MENTTSIDIVDLIENNPISKFNTTKYQSRLIEKLQSKFTNYQQQLFLSSFYCYLKYDKINDYVIDLDNVWKWMGHPNKSSAKTALVKNFAVDRAYKILLVDDDPELETFLMNTNTFKIFCLRALTKKANIYFIFK